jgi:hypothetical protein
LVALQDEDALFRFILRRWDFLHPLDQRRVREAMDRRLAVVGTVEIEHGLQHLINTGEADQQRHP